jgi:exonuclease VII large subunit
MADDLIPILTRFHREVVLPDIQRIVSDSVEGAERRLRDEMQSLFDSIAQRLDRLETEYQMPVAGLNRVENRLDAMEQRLDKVALRSELLELKARVENLQNQVRIIEERLSA